MISKSAAVITCVLVVIFMASTGFCQQQRLNRTDAKPINKTPRLTAVKPVETNRAVDIRPISKIPHAPEPAPINAIPVLTEPKPVSSLHFLSIIPENKTYNDGNKIWIRVTVTNTYEEDMNPYGYLQFGALNTNTKARLRFSYRNMAEAGYEYIPEMLWIDQTLKPSESIERRIDVAVFLDFPKGEYKLTFTFVPWEENENPLHKTIYLSNAAKIEVK